jgi:two-component system chemotaxis response regulator CheY
MTKHILVADDSAAMRQILEATLVEAGYRVTLAVHGKDALLKALAASAATPFELVLTDQNMPELTGLELIAALRELAAYVSTPILVLTTEEGDAFKAAAREAGATGWLLKPLDPQTLTDVLATLVEPERA